jgi:penicillin-binding protein 2
MKVWRLILTFIILIVSTGCTSFTPPADTPTPTLAATSTLPGPVVNVTRVPDPQASAREFLQSWKDENYAQMYAALTQLSRDAVTAEDFEKLYRSAAVKMTLKGIDYQVLSSLTNPASAQVAYKVTFRTTLLGSLEYQMMMNLALEAGRWLVEWEEGLLLPDLRGGNKLDLDYEIPLRGNIYDRSGQPIVAQADAVALGIVPGEIDGDQEKLLLSELASLTNLTTDYIKGLYEYALPDWYIPVGEASSDQVAERYGVLSSLAGLRMTTFRSRYYYEGGIASQTVGYVLSIPADQLEEYQRLGYRGDEKIGWDGLEQWAEPYLAGKHGASLYVKDAEGRIVTRLAQTDPAPAQEVYSTLDMELQLRLQQSFGGYRGSAIVMELDTGRILAMVSSPGFDPNLFEPTNTNNLLLNQVLADEDRPLYNRAAQGVYPLGSVFKIITMATALESGVFSPESSYACGHTFTELEGITLYDWTYTHDLPPSGTLTLPEGLMRSCNPWFWHIGLELWNQGYESDLAEMARAFGLGSKTNVGQIVEQAGAVPDSTSVSDNVQLAIGQGALLVTPLQVVSFTAAVGNGGTLYQPQLIERIVPINGAPTYEFKPVVRSMLPVSPENLAVIQGAMRSVIANRRGTAFYVLTNLPVPAAGKTGTAQNPNGDAHAWFTGYTMAGRENRPDIAVVVMLENAGEGSEMAAPIFRRVVSMYFSGNTNPGGLMPWEASPYVLRSPTPSETDTPTPEVTDTPAP